ncbi:MAG: 3-hydroxybutyrate dehydrogenase [Pseudomonadota bacterium]
MTDTPLKGKNAVVTGSTSGIGLGFAEGLAHAGANVMMNGFGDAGEIETNRARLASEAGVQVAYNGADMTKPEEIEALIAETNKAFGSVDIVVNNAGIQHVSPIDEFPIGKWDAIIAINLSSAFHTIRASLPLMRKQGWGRLVNLASVHGLRASPYKAAYVSAKHGMLGLTKTVALEVAEDNITCNAICPGYVKTPLVENQLADTAKARGMTEDEVMRNVILEAQPTKKFVEFEELNGLLVYMCSDAGASLNGASIPVDGGWTAK